jgi:hypothetical protein
MISETPYKIVSNRLNATVITPEANEKDKPLNTWQIMCSDDAIRAYFIASPRNVVLPLYDALTGKYMFSHDLKTPSGNPITPHTKHVESRLHDATQATADHARLSLLVLYNALMEFQQTTYYTTLSGYDSERLDDVELQQLAQDIVQSLQEVAPDTSIEQHEFSAQKKSTLDHVKEFLRNIHAVNQEILTNKSKSTLIKPLKWIIVNPSLTVQNKFTLVKNYIFATWKQVQNGTVDKIIDRHSLGTNFIQSGYFYFDNERRLVCTLPESLTTGYMPYALEVRMILDIVKNTPETLVDTYEAFEKRVFDLCDSFMLLRRETTTETISRKQFEYTLFATLPGFLLDLTNDYAEIKKLLPKQVKHNIISLLENLKIAK